MNDYASDEEQIEAIRKWWSENGKFIIAGIVLGIAGLVGYRSYQANMLETAQSASEVYSRMIDAVEENNTDVAIAAQQELARDYGKTPYAAQSWLAAAKLHMDNGQTDSAIEALKAMLDADAHPDLKRIARLRLARTLSYVERHDEARALVAGYDAGSFQARFSDALGDIEAAANNPEAAREAYLAAITESVDTRMIDSNLVTLKIAALGLASDTESDMPVEEPAETELPK